MNFNTFLEVTGAALAGALCGGAFVWQGIIAMEDKYSKLLDASQRLYDNVKGFTNNPSVSMRGSDFGLQLAPEMFMLQQAIYGDD